MAIDDDIRDLRDDSLRDEYNEYIDEEELVYGDNPDINDEVKKKYNNFVDDMKENDPKEKGSFSRGILSFLGDLTGLIGELFGRLIRGILFGRQYSNPRNYKELVENEQEIDKIKAATKDKSQSQEEQAKEYSQQRVERQLKRDLSKDKQNFNPTLTEEQKERANKVISELLKESGTRYLSTGDITSVDKIGEVLLGALVSDKGFENYKELISENISKNNPPLDTYIATQLFMYALVKKSGLIDVAKEINPNVDLSYKAKFGHILMNDNLYFNIKEKDGDIKSYFVDCTDSKNPVYANGCKTLKANMLDDFKTISNELDKARYTIFKTIENFEYGKEYYNKNPSVTSKDEINAFPWENSGKDNDEKDESFEKKTDASKTEERGTSTNEKFENRDGCNDTLKPEPHISPDIEIEITEDGDSLDSEESELYGYDPCFRDIADYMTSHPDESTTKDLMAKFKVVNDIDRWFKIHEQLEKFGVCEHNNTVVMTNEEFIAKYQSELQTQMGKEQETEDVFNDMASEVEKIEKEELKANQNSNGVAEYGDEMPASEYFEDEFELS